MSTSNPIKPKWDGLSVLEVVRQAYSVTISAEGAKKTSSPTVQIENDFNDNLEFPAEGFPDIGMFEEGTFD